MPRRPQRPRQDQELRQDQAYDRRRRVITGIRLPPPDPEVRVYERHNPCSNRDTALSNRALASCFPPDTGCHISMVEIATFFPDWKEVPELAHRALLNGWTAFTTVGIELMTRNLLSDISEERFEDEMNDWHTSVHKAFREACNVFDARLEHGKDAIQKAFWKREVVDDLSADEWEAETTGQVPRKFEHFKLRCIWEQVPRENWPKGDDRMVVTRCLEFAASNPHLDLDTSHWDWIIDLHDLSRYPHGNAYDDLDACARYRDIVETAVHNEEHLKACKRTMDWDMSWGDSDEYLMEDV